MDHRESAVHRTPAHAGSTTAGGNAHADSAFADLDTNLELQESQITSQILDSIRVSADFDLVSQRDSIVGTVSPDIQIPDSPYWTPSQRDEIRRIYEYQINERNRGVRLVSTGVSNTAAPTYEHIVRPDLVLLTHTQSPNVRPNQSNDTNTYEDEGDQLPTIGQTRACRQHLPLSRQVFDNPRFQITAALSAENMNNSGPPPSLPTPQSGDTLIHGELHNPGHTLRAPTPPLTIGPVDATRLPFLTDATGSNSVPRPGLGQPGYAEHPLNLPPEPKCTICLESPGRDKFSYICLKCHLRKYCDECLVRCFVGASKDESRMPPRCCSIIDVSAVENILTQEQLQLYMAKFEEWQTPNRLYCPNPKCSVFISPRLFVSPTNSNDNSPQPTDHLKQGKHFSPTATVARCVLCPKCSLSVCTSCHARTHEGDCATDIDLLLEGKLKKWGYKRCPKCRTGVRKMYGCNHVQCRCGAHFCFSCLSPITQCYGECGEDEDYDEDEDDDLDAQIGFYEGDGHELGDEPGEMVGPWGCNHIWVLLNSSDSLIQCTFCYRAFDQQGVGTGQGSDGLPPTGLGVAGSEGSIAGGINDEVWNCSRCSRVICKNCKLDL